MKAQIRKTMKALLAHLTAAAQITFTGDTEAGSQVISNVDMAILDALVEGLPVFGAGVEKGATIESIDPQARTCTLDLPISTDGTAAPFSIGFLTTGRRVKHWDQVQQQPALFVRRTGMIDTADHGSGFITTGIEGEIWIYSNAGQNPNAVPDDTLAALEELLRRSLKADGDYGDTFFTLGGLVYWCRIEGQSDISSGDQDGQAIARLSVRITLP